MSVFTGSAAWTKAITTAGPFGLLIMPWGENDATGGPSAATFRTQLELNITQARTAGFNGSILLVEMPKRGNATEPIWESFRAEIEAVAAADPDITVFDLRRRTPDYGTAEATELGLYADEAHYKDKGQGWVADQIASAILPR
ncbi:hypothetical protein [Arthrobacter sp. H35-D1]|uniref:hypothetical protein n=1 Tax=Arthrobacter sp. H35-D1 TaxID=3046202 RepID=UPI0024B96520|nr:hypothetical protein [Arthrobacter sp. H35-D1]MDJ0314018.1 hypothetical protein [Arthrobacter sp. H35-D1]